MEAFTPVPPEWTNSATHAFEFCCPTCRSSCNQAHRVWLNRLSPVMTEDYHKKWQEFYQCQCGTVWWAWSSDRPPSEFANREIPPSF
ncbi:hypothetical protein [Limnofasciculus baicalensis]|uniref:Uncharacterized protein n=1 Tax=Limnofasciculus baicalensis BBK-W-15 TaxID=2699891 RepID=A0AAE3GQQ7_9CYAN|nr:hypothetical protein [Limnofasciculus baicalensis]MCP2728123.1 hypothetical protein [Limnofasciculus baicalensis BBK-W-15]